MNKDILNLANPQAPEIDNMLTPDQPPSKNPFWKKITSVFKKKVKPLISIKLEKFIQDSGLDGDRSLLLTKIQPKEGTLQPKINMS